MRARYCLIVMLVAQVLGGMASVWMAESIPLDPLFLIAVLLPWALFASVMWLVAGDRLAALRADWAKPSAAAWWLMLRLFPFVLLAEYGLGIELEWFGAHYWEGLYRYVSNDGIVLPSGGLLSWLLWGAALVVVAPVCEEWFFRGLLLRRWQAKWGAVPALLLTSALFGSVHPAVLPQFVLGMVCGALLIKSGSLWPAIGLHALNNLLACGLMLVFPRDMSLALLDQLHPFAFIAALIGLTVLVAWLRRVTPGLRAAVPVEMFRFPARAGEVAQQPELSSVS
ncbi:MAG: CPBP family intramembrane metalloprotease [Rhodocyclaceae bacterium]